MIMLSEQKALCGDKTTPSAFRLSIGLSVSNFVSVTIQFLRFPFKFNIRFLVQKKSSRISVILAQINTKAFGITSSTTGVAWTDLIHDNVRRK